MQTEQGFRSEYLTRLPCCLGRGMVRVAGTADVHNMLVDKLYVSNPFCGISENTLDG